MAQYKPIRKFLNIIFLFPILFCACENPQSPIKSGYPIEGNVRFNFREYFTDTINGPKILLTLQTEKLYNRTGINIITSYAEGNNNYFLMLSGVVEGAGFEGQSPAIWKRHVTPSSVDHWINFEYLMNRASFQFTVTDTSIIIHDTSTTFMIPDYLVYWRFPVNSFAYYFLGDSNRVWLCNNFLDTLINNISLQEYHFPDYGQICYINSNCCLNNVTPRKVFKYQHETDYYRAGELFKEYKTNVLSQYPDVLLTLYNWRARIYE